MTTSAEPWLERAFIADAETLASFLINALYLFGNHRILVSGGFDPEVTQVLTRFGHRIDAEGVPDPRASPGGRHDRAVSVARALGYGTEAETLAWLRAMRKTLAAGGLICFHVIDRDRAWSLAGDRIFPHEGGELRGRVGFDPATGRLSAQVRGTAGKNGGETGAGQAARGPGPSVRAYNLPEIRALLASAGFALERVYGDWNGGSPEETGERTGRLIVVASKRRVRPRPRLRARSAPGLRG